MRDEDRRQILEGWLRDHGGLISRLVRAYAFDAHDREDLFQEIAFQLWESIPRFKRESAVSTWIYRVCLYASMAWSQRERRHSDRAQELEQVPALEEQAEDPRLEWLYAEIARLDGVNRSVVLLVLEGLSYREIADTLGISESNVGVRMHRARKLLADRSGPGGANDGL